MAGEQKTGGSANESGKTADDAAAAAAATAAAEKKTADDAAAAAAAGAGGKKTGAAGDTTETERNAAAAAAAAKAPEKYELSIPKGAESWLDDVDLKNIEKIARAKNLTNEAAQAMIEERADEMAAASTLFRQETEKHEVYGGDHLMQTTKDAERVLDAFAPKDDPLGARLRSHLVKTGMGSELSVVAFLAKIGKQMGEDSHVAGGGAGGSNNKDKSTAEVLYGPEKKS